MRSIALTFAAGLALAPASAHADGYDTVRAALDAGDHETAYAELAELGDTGDTLAMLMLANLQLADFRRANLGLAIAWLEEAAEQGSTRAMIELGAIYEQQGPWLFPDREGGAAAMAVGYPEAVHWYGRAADAGSVEALYRLGALYSLRLYSLLDGSMTPEEEDRLAREFLERAVAAGSVRAMWPLAMMVRRDDEVRHRQLTLDAARLGDPTALGMVAARPDLVGIDDEVEAVAWAMAAMQAWALERNPRSQLFNMIGAQTGDEFLALMDSIIDPDAPDVRAAAEERAAEITASWTSLLPGHSDGGEGGGSLFGRD